MQATSAGLKVSHAAEQIAVHRDGLSAPLVVQRAPKDKRPFIHPILAPDGNGVLTENEPPHHPWQHGLYVGLNDVNGVGFWTEGLRNDPKDGTFHPQPLEAPLVNSNAVRWTVRTEWRGPLHRNREVLLHETQAWTLTDNGADIILDLEWTLAARVDLTFGKYSYGGLFLRMPYKKETGGRALNSEGRVNGEAEGQRARWIAVSMPIAGRTTPAGIAIMDHPANPEFPSPWRVDGQLGIAPSRCIAGAWTLAAGKSSTMNHRVLVFCGESDPAAIETRWQKYTNCRR